MSGLRREEGAEARPKSVRGRVGGGLNIGRSVGGGLDGSSFADELGGAGAGAGSGACQVAQNLELFSDS